MSEARLAGLVRALPPGLTEIYLHPATEGSFNGSDAGYAYREELDALLAESVRAAVTESGARLGGFADFAP